MHDGSFRTTCEWPVNYLIMCCHVFKIPKHCKLPVARKKTTMAGTHDVDRLAIGNAELRVDYLCLQENLCFKMSIYIYVCDISSSRFVQDTVQKSSIATCSACGDCVQSCKHQASYTIQLIIYFMAVLGFHAKPCSIRNP